MTAIHHHTVRVAGPPCRVPLACNGLHAALSVQRTTVSVWWLQDLGSKPLELVGHRRPITAVALNHRSFPALLCSCADDYVIVWNLDKAQAAVDAGHPVRGQIVGTSLAGIQYCSFNGDDTLVAVCQERQVLVLDAKNEDVVWTLEGHTAPVNCAEFCPHYSSTLITAGDDRTFKVWDVNDGILIYQSTIISSSPFISLTMNPLQESFAVGTSDGQIRVYDLTEGNGFRNLQHIDVTKLLGKLREKTKREENDKSCNVISSRPSWQRTETNGPPLQESPESDDETEIGAAILALMYTIPVGQSRAPTPAKLPFLQQDQSLVRDLLGRAPLLVAATTAALLQVNARTLEPCVNINLLDPVPSCSIMMEENVTVPLVGTASIAQNPVGDEMWCVTSGLFVSDVSVLAMSLPSETDVNQLRLQLAATRLSISQNELPLVETEQEAEQQITVLSSAPLVESSPLKAELLLKSKEQKSSKGAAASRRASTGSVAGRPSSAGSRVNDKPLVFHDKVKSSGYTAAPRRGMFEPKTNHTKSAKPRSSPSMLSKMSAKQYPMNSDPPTKVKVKLDVAERPTSVNTLRFSADGQLLACALVNTSTQVFRMPLTGKGMAFTGHNATVTSAQWSQDSKWLVTSCEDKTACLWSLGLSDPVMTFANVKDNFGVDREGGLKFTKDNPTFNKPVRFAQFYYMDKFILLTHGSTFALYKYHVDTSKSDIRRYLNNNRYKLVQSFQMSSAQQITAFSAINTFYSYLALCAGSDKSLEVFDLNVGCSVRTMRDVHLRPPHKICQNAGSVFVSHPTSAYDLFVTAAANDCIKLWDLRSNRCVRRYEGHANRIYPCGATISPCSRFIATGSEDRCAYIFDIRSGTYLHKLTGHTDTVGDVEYHPLYPELVTASVDGKLRLFTVS